MSSRPGSACSSETTPGLETFSYGTLRAPSISSRARLVALSEVRTRFVAALARSSSAKALNAPTMRTKEATRTSMSVKPAWARRREASVGTLTMRSASAGADLSAMDEKPTRSLNDEAGPGGPASRSGASADAAYHWPLLGQPFSPSVSHVRVTPPSDALMTRKTLVVFGCVTVIVYASTVL